MHLASVRIIVTDIQKIVKFYERATGISAVWYTEDFAELKTGSATLAIGSTRTLSFFGDEAVAKAAQNATAIIEFIVADVDKDYERLADFIQPYMIQEPTTMPWGNRSLLFRDPDGNLVNFFTPASAEAIRKFAGKIDKG